MLGGSYQIGKISGIPIRVHMTLLIILPIFALDFARVLGPHSFFWGLIAAAGLFASVALHELGHSIVALNKGYGVREILLLPIGGIAQLESIPRNPRDEFQVAIAGPLVSLALAGTGWFVAPLLAGAHLIHAAGVFSLLAMINLMLVLFNLLPSFPMDGGRIFRAWLTPRIGRLNATRIAAKTGRFMAIVFGIIGLIHFNIFLIIIAFFIYQAAGAEYRMVRIQESTRRTQSGPWVSMNEQWPYDEQVEVSPPPFQHGGKASSIFVKPIRAQHDLFDDLFQKWK